MRSTLDDILMTAAKELRHAADQVEAALTSRINCVTECVQRMENDLRDVILLINYHKYLLTNKLFPTDFTKACGHWKSHWMDEPEYSRIWQFYESSSNPIER